MNSLQNQLLNRFVDYVKTWTTSDESEADKGVQPSTERQRDFAITLSKELHTIGNGSLTDIQVTDFSYVYARLLATPGYESVPSIGFIAHLDTVDEVSGQNVNPQIIKNYDGHVINYGQVVLDPATDKFLSLAAKNNETIITTDGTTLLGADDKAGITAIMTAIETLTNSQLPHGQVEILFSPDEETGHGMDHVPLDLIKSKVCFTIDGGHVGELETECFNAYKSVITFTGKAKHTGTARPDMVNAVTLASNFVTMLPKHESPETTDGYQGFYAPMTISGSIEQSSLTIFVRDFTESGMQHRLDTISAMANVLEKTNKGASIKVENTEQYRNMGETLAKHPEITKILKQAAYDIGITPIFSPIRGGTDGSRLTEMGIPTPNIFTGGHNYHSRSEWVSLEQMEKSTEFILQLIKLYSKAGAKN